MGKKLKVLIVANSDDETLIILQRLAKQGFEVIHKRVTDSGEMEMALADRDWDIVISKYLLPRFSGIEALKLLQSKGLTYPCILVSGEATDEIVVDNLMSWVPNKITKGQSRSSSTIERDLKSDRKAKSWLAGKFSVSAEECLALFENSLEAILLTSPDGSIHAANKEAQRIFGLSEEQLIKNSRDGLIDKADPRLAPGLEERKRTGKFRGELNFRRADGSIFPGEISTSLFPDDNGQIKTAMIIRDISERKKAEDSLKASEEFSSSLLENNPNPMVVAYPDTTIMHVNLAFEQITGFSAAEVIGTKRPYPYWRKEDYAEYTRLIDANLLKNSYRKELCFVKKNGEMFWVDMESRVVKQINKVKFILSTWTDTSGRRAMEKTLEESREQLRKFSIHVQETMEEERTRLAREIHDELGQIMTTLEVNLSLMPGMWPSAPPELVKKVAAMRLLVEEGEEVVRKVNADLRPPILDKLGLGETIKWLVGQMEEKTGVKGVLAISDSLRLDSELSLDIFRIVQEALTNVSQHAQATRVRVVIRPEQDNLRMTIRDNGQGIQPEDFQKPQSFGLIGIRERVQKWGGRVVFAGEPGKGTSISLTIPLKRVTND